MPQTKLEKVPAGATKVGSAAALPDTRRRPLARWFSLLPPLLILVLGSAAYLNSFTGCFLFDDERGILGDDGIRHVWPFPGAPFPRPRSLALWTLAWNYALGGLHAWGYHAFNLLAHLLAALTLYALVLATLLLPSLPPRSRPAARWFALAVSLIWAVHPLQTESVTYVIQRLESLVSLFYLLTLLCLLRGAQARATTLWWYAGCVLCCVLGMLCKEVMITAPLLALLYDRVFLSSSWRELVYRRGLVHLALAATLVLLFPALTGAFALPRTATTAPEPSAGFSMTSLSGWQYARSQPGVILHYLRLVFWPDTLCLDYGWPIADPVSAILPGILVGFLVLVALVTLFLRPPLGFVGLSFFLILAPTSTVLPIADLAVEHRLYLALAAPLILVVLAAEWLGCFLGRRLELSPAIRVGLAATLLAAVVLPLTWRTVLRNEDYHDPLRMWSATVLVRPNNARAQANLGRFLTEEGRLPEAEQHCRLALQLRPNYPQGESFLGNCLLRQHRLEEAEEHCRTALRLDPDQAANWTNLGVCLALQKRADEAEEQFRHALKLRPDAQAHANLGNCLLNRSRLVEAEEHFRQALQLDPDNALCHSRLARLLMETGKGQEALAHFEAAARLQPRNAHACYNLGVTLLRLGQDEQGWQYLRKANQLDPRLPLPPPEPR